MARILIPSVYAMHFNGPRHSKHDVRRTRFIGRQQSVWRPLGALALHDPRERADLVHSFNTIPPYSTKPWIVTFESKLPRALGKGGDTFAKLLAHRLAHNNCKKLIAMSDFALHTFQKQSTHLPKAHSFADKAERLWPALSPVARAPKSYRPGTTLHLTFIGNDWAWKGGVVAARLAVEAERRRLPVKIHIVSSLTFNHRDDARHNLYAADLQTLYDQSNVLVHGRLPNSEVNELLSRSHVLLLPSVDETFGYSILEGFAHALPAIASRVRAIPEFVHHETNGLLLDIDATDGMWSHLGCRNWDCFNDAYRSLSAQAIYAVERIIAGQVPYQEMSEAALHWLSTHHCPHAASERLDEIYDAAL